MSSFRKKSSSSTEDTSSTSFSGSTSSSGSSSGSESGSSSSDTETSSTLEDKRQTQPPKPNNDSIQKSQVTTRRKSSEVKTSSSSTKIIDAEKKSTPAAIKQRSSNSVSGQQQRLSRSNEISSEDEIPPNKKPTRLLNSSITATQRKKTTAVVPTKATTQQQQAPLNGAGGGGKAPPAVVKQHHQQNLTSKVTNKLNMHKECPPTTMTTTTTSTTTTKAAETKQNAAHFSSVASSEHSESESFATGKKEEKKIASKPNAAAAAAAKMTSTTATTSKLKTSSAVASRTLPKRNVSSNKTHSRLKSSDDSESESGSSSGDGSSSSSETDQSETSNSSASQTLKTKTTTSKRNLGDANSTEAGNKLVANRDRKLTRSLSTRRSKSFLNRGAAAAADASDSESDMDGGGDLAVVSSKSPCKKVLPTALTKTSSSNKKECTPIDKPRSQSPQFAHIEKKCSIEGCDSSGHLSGNQDKHFLAEACPIFHNMSASECKERANERKQREEFRQKTAGAQQDSIRKQSLSTEQREFLTKIRESRARFRPMQGGNMVNSDKIKVEKVDCQDEDREPTLTGLVPDYDLQLFREAQAIASEKIEDELSDLPVGKGIKYITMGKYKMKVWYQSPYPDDAARLPKMYICEFCLRYQKSETGIKRHAQKCVWRHPPGDEIYRKGKLQVWQVDGKRHKQYCQHLCLLAKFFLDHKTLYYDVEPFLFYIMTLADVDGCHTVGYFSKEKNSFYNVSCILTLPPYQRKGYGRLLIDFSYLLTRVEGKIGSPEKPLSDLGLISYRSYWKDVLLDYLCNRSGSTLSIKDVSQEMAIYSYDIVSTLQALGMMKYWKGKHIVLKKQDVLDEYEERVKRRGNFPKIDDSCLRWSPFVPPQTSASN